jgi:hypothetical protein
VGEQLYKNQIKKRICMEETKRIERIEITRKHCELMGDLFINDCIDGKKIEDLIIPEMKRYLGDRNATISVSLALQKAGLEHGMMAGTIASRLTGDRDIPLVFPDNEEVEMKPRETAKINQK